MLWGAVGFMVIASVLRLWAAAGQPIRWERVQLGGLKTSLGGMFAGMVAGGLLTWLLLTDGLADIGITLYDNLRPLLLEEYGVNEAQIGLLFSWQATVYLLVSLFGSRMADRWNAVGTLAIGRLLQVASLVLLVSNPSIPTFFLYFALDGLAFGLGDPAFDAMLARSAPKGNLGMTFGMFRTAINVFSMPMPYLGSLLWERNTPTTPFWWGAGVLFAAGLLVWGKLKPLSGKVPG